MRNRVIGVDDPISTDRNSAVPPHTTSYTYDVASNKKSEQRANDQTITYDTYDKMNRLTQMTVHQAPTADAVTKYTWTRGGRVDTMTDPRLKVYNYDYDTLHRLTKLLYPVATGESARRSGVARRNGVASIGRVAQKECREGRFLVIRQK